MSKNNNLFKTTSQNRQHGKVSLQTAFWIVGITVGVLSIAQTAFNLFDSEETQTVLSQETVTNITDSPIEPSVDAPPKLAVLDSPSIKVDNYTAYESGVVVDETLGIMWMRCSLGQTWDGSNCTGDADTYTLEEAKQALEQLNKVNYAGLSGWQLPDIEALHSLLYCSEGFEDSYEILVKSGDTKTVAINCAGNYIKPAIKANLFPNTYWSVWNGYWSNSQNVEGKPLALYFNTGEIKAKSTSHYVRAMRYME